ncbi:hypothetical protein GCM10011532_28390 [Christiangramia forsetii]|nr:hypothetical protein GCM10011532_28390 [Christiangramia forsetii]
MNDKRILDSKEERIENLENKLSEVEAEVENAKLTDDNEDYFSLKNNEDAITYFENKGINSEELILRIEDEIISNNKAGEDNPLVPMDGMEGNMRINKIKVLNHKWIIADFTDGTYWGEVFLSYQVSEDGAIEFFSEKSFIYPQY